MSAPCLRNGHARAVAMGKAVRFSQQNAEELQFPDNSFDLVVSHALLHETSHKAIRRIFRETHRVLRPGGVMAHLDSMNPTWARCRTKILRRSASRPDSRRRNAASSRPTHNTMEAVRKQTRRCLPSWSSRRERPPNKLRKAPADRPRAASLPCPLISPARPREGCRLWP